MDNKFETYTMIRYLIGASQIPYELLNNLFQPIKIKQDKIILHVDAHSIFYRLYRENGLRVVENYPSELIIKDIVVSFLNVLGHYRRYIMTRLHKSNTIIVYFNPNQPKYQEEYLPEYCSHLYKRYRDDNKDYAALTNIVKKSYEFIRGIVPYFEGIYCINNDDCDNYSLIASMIDSDQTDAFHILFSKNEILTQLITPKTIQLWNARDKSYIIHHKNVFDRSILHDKDVTAVDIPYQLLPLMWTIVGCSDVSVPHTKYMGQMKKMIQTLNDIATKVTLNPNMSLDYFMDLIQPYLLKHKKEFKDDQEALENRYRVLNLNIASKAITSNQKERYAADFYDLFDETGLEKINETLASIGNNPDVIGITNLNMNTTKHSIYDGSW